METLRKGLKVGEPFQDGKRKFVVLEVLENGDYITGPYVEPVAAEEQPIDEEKYICRYCGKECKNALGLASHERACKEREGGEE